ncbi:RHS repeat-associated core domain-containing protein [Corallococcus macrosporus]|uniref:RHS repeat-associated core domain-containing protein n=1 Tax=Corallococcus macrosporus TaxID=35 RepID=A0ABS3DMM8_9BACT|nr:RHS repeat-associated core domain-containing protein [Corallococcus macrosporus]MBN8232579.1 RHS repeat-associated core domain-containing protein [Corallococcus macrosporus]
MSSPRVNLSDFTTRFSAADLGVQGELGGLNFLRKYVSTDNFWSYQSMLGNSNEPFLPKPFGSSPSRTSSLRWWHTLYSFVYVKGTTPGVSTWAVRDIEGEVLEFAACSLTSAGCFAAPRTTSRWSNASLYRAADGTFVLVKPGEGRFVYASKWMANGVVSRYFLTRVEEDRLSGTPRVRLSLAYATPTNVSITCPGASTLGNGVPYLSTVTTEEGATLRLVYRQIYAKPPSPVWECVISQLMLRTNPNAPAGTSPQESVVAEYKYALLPDFETAGVLAGVDYPETGDSIRYTDTTSSSAQSTSWNVSVNQMSLVEHQYQNGKVSVMGGGTTSAVSMSAGAGNCDGPDAMGTGSGCTPPAAEALTAPSGDSAGSTVQFRRTFFARSSSYSPHSLLSSVRDICLSETGNCISFAEGYITYTYATPADGTLYLQSVGNKLGRYAVTNKTFAAAGAQSAPGVVSPALHVSRAVGQDLSGNNGVPGVTTDYAYASFPPGATANPWKPVQTTTNTVPSVIQPGAVAATRSTYDEKTRFLKSVIRSGYTQVFDPASGTWSNALRHVGVFYFNHGGCFGGPDTGDTRLTEVHGPCFVSGPEATECSGSDYPLTQYQYYGPPSAEPSARAGRLQSVSKYYYGCSGYPGLTTTYNQYDARGNATQITSPQGVVTTLQYQGGRIVSSTSQGLVTTYLYEGAVQRASRLPTGNYSVNCYRTGTPVGQGCTGGQKTTLLQWTAIASDELGADWSEKMLRTYWPNGSLKSEETRSRRNGVEESRTLITHHPDPQARDTYSRIGQGAGSIASVKGFDANDNLIASGRPFNNPPDFCRDPNLAISSLCTSMEYDPADRLTRVSNSLSGQTRYSRFDYDGQGNVDDIRLGCTPFKGGCDITNSYQHDDFGNVVQIKLPHATAPIHLEHNAAGQLRLKQSEVMHQAGEWLEYDYDMVGRPKRAARRTGGSAPVTEVLYQLGYDADAVMGGDCGDNELNSYGLPRFREDSFGRTWYRYDAQRRLVGEVRQRQGTSDCSPALETQYAYDSAGRLSTIRYPYGRLVTYAYGVGANAHRVSAIDVGLFTGVGIQTRRLVSNIVWEPFGGLRGYQANPTDTTSRAVEYALGDNGTQPPSGCSVGFPSSSASDLTGRLRSLRVSSGGFTPGTGSGDIYKRTYTWTADQVVRMDTCVLGATTPRTELFDYDSMLRLISATRPPGNDEATGGAFQDQAFGYDARGNRRTFTQWHGAEVNQFTYGLGRLADRLLSTKPEFDPSQKVAFSYDADGRVVGKQLGLYVTDTPANVLDLRYSPFDASGGHGSARESVFRAVRVNGATYSYFYDAMGRRRAKVNPFNQRDEFFHDSRSELLVDQGWSDVFQSSFRVVDDYVWLGGRPIILLRGRLDATMDTRASDATADCRRDGEAAACGIYFPITDNVGKPVVMLDGAGRVSGVADYQPFGHVNRFSVKDSTLHPYGDDDSETISGFVQPPENAQVQVRVRPLFQYMDTHDSDDGAEIWDADTSTLLARVTGQELGRVTTPWLHPAAGRIVLNFVAGPADASGPNTSSGMALEGYEYQRYQTGAQPFWTPLRFAGHYHDAETDLFENRNRYYDPSVGRYLQPEPLLAKPSYVVGAARNAGMAPAYSYAFNNPVAFIDPDGLAARCPGGNWFGGPLVLGEAGGAIFGGIVFAGVYSCLSAPVTVSIVSVCGFGADVVTFNKPPAVAPKLEKGGMMPHLTCEVGLGYAKNTEDVKDFEGLSFGGFLTVGPATLFVEGHNPLEPDTYGLVVGVPEGVPVGGGVLACQTWAWEL